MRGMVLLCVCVVLLFWFRFDLCCDAGSCVFDVFDCLNFRWFSYLWFWCFCLGLGFLVILGYSGCLPVVIVWVLYV